MYIQVGYTHFGFDEPHVFRVTGVYQGYFTLNEVERRVSPPPQGTVRPRLDLGRPAEFTV